MAKAHRKESVTVDTTSFVVDRIAKIASTYTGKKCNVRYVGENVCTDALENITLPARMRLIAEGRHLDACKTDAERDEARKQEKIAFAYNAHEAGHMDVNQRLHRAVKNGERAQCSKALYNLVPAELKRFAVKPGGQIVTMNDWCDPRTAQGIAKKAGAALADVHGGDPETARKQLFSLCNGVEDWRMERGNRWTGMQELLDFARNDSHQRWRKMGDEIQAKGEDKSFHCFAVGLLIKMDTGDSAFMGSIVDDQVACVWDIAEIFMAEATKDAHGWADAVNATLAMISRVYRKEAPAPAPEATCPACGSKNLKGIIGGGKLRIVCLDCGAEEEAEIEEGPAGPGDSEDPLEIEYEDAPEVTDSDEADEGSESDAEAGDEGQGGESDSDEDADGSDGEDANGDSGDSEEGETDGGNSDSESEYSDAPKLKVGSTVRLKSTGELAIVKAIDGEDLDVEVINAA